MNKRIKRERFYFWLKGVAREMLLIAVAVLLILIAINI